MSLTIKAVTKKFGKDKVALNDVNLKFKNGQVTGLIGFNGSGKTTLYNVILNFLENHQGEVLLEGKPITQEDLKYFTFLGAGAETKNSTIVKKYLLLIADLYFLPKKDAIEKIEKIAKKIDFFENLNKPIKSLSKGNQQKIKVIASFLNPHAKYLILDEPFDGLDPLMVKNIAKMYMNMKDMTIIITSHRMEVVQEMCKEFFVIKNGVVIDSKVVEQKSVFVEVNSEVALSKIQKQKFVISVSRSEKGNLIRIEDISHYKALTALLIKDSKYVFSTIKEKNIAESVFLGYGDGGQNA